MGLLLMGCGLGVDLVKKARHMGKYSFSSYRERVVNGSGKSMFPQGKSWTWTILTNIPVYV